MSGSFHKVGMDSLALPILPFLFVLLFNVYAWSFHKVGTGPTRYGLNSSLVFGRLHKCVLNGKTLVVVTAIILCVSNDCVSM